MNIGIQSMKLPGCVLCLLSLSCTPIVESMLLSPRDGSTDVVVPDGPDILPDRDVAPDQPADGEDVLVDAPVVTVNTECNYMTLPDDFSCYSKPNCGNDSIQCGENCDQNNLNNGDGCDPACLLETKVCTWAGPIFDPADVVVEGDHLYVSDDSSCFILKIPLGGGDAMLFAGQPGQCEYRDGAAADARFNGPMGLEVMGSSLVVVDSRNNLVRTVNMSDRTVATVAGGGDGTAPLDGDCDQIRFSMPMGIATDGESLYVADMGNGRVAVIQDPLGSCSVHSLPQGELVRPAALAIDFSSPTHLYVTDSMQNAIYRYDLPSGMPVAIAGNPGSAGAENGVGAAATFDRPLGIDSNGVILIVADSANHLLREIEIEPFCDQCRVSTMAGSARAADCVDTMVRGDASRLSGPRCVTFEGPYRFFFCDSGCDAIRVGK